MNRSAKNVPDVIGLTQREAETKLKKAGFSVRLRFLDGKALMGTTDWDPNRVNLSVNSGKVTEISTG